MACYFIEWKVLPGYVTSHVSASRTFWPVLLSLWIVATIWLAVVEFVIPSGHLDRGRV
jgi:hypothetical protein